MNLYKASNQWAQRPADERFSSLDEMVAATKVYADISQEFDVRPSTLAIAVEDNEPVLVGEAGRPAKLTHWAFTQLAQRAGAGGAVDYLRSLPPEYLPQPLNYSLLKRAVETEDKPLKLLIHSNGNLLLRALTGIGYKRFWNYRIAEGLKQLADIGWRVPPARPAFEGQPGSRIATAADVLPDTGFGLSIREGDLIAPAGLYASDHDMFAFMVNEDYRIAVPGNPAGLARGFFVEHSEVGDSAYKVTCFLYENVCGNHIVWSASEVKEISFKHTGNAIERITDNLEVGLREYVGQSSLLDEQRIQHLAGYELGGNKLEVIDVLFNKRLLSRTMAGRAYDACEQEQTPVDGSNPRTPWGIAQGLTRVSQASSYADQRAVIDKAAGKVLEAYATA